MAAAAAAIVVPRASRAAQTDWIGATGDWQSPANWSFEIPTSSDDAVISDGGTAQISSESDVAASLTLGASAGQSGSLQIAAGGNLLVNGAETIGVVGTGNLTQLDGTNTASGTLTLGTNGYYGLQGGSLIAGTIQVNSGTLSQTGGTLSFTTLNETGGSVNGGTFTAPLGSTINQSGGAFNVDQLFLAVGGSGGTFNLSGGTLTASDPTISEIVGYAGTASFVQTGGTNSAQSIAVGYIAGVSASYALSGQSLLSVNGNEEIGYYGTGTITQSGGTNSATGTLTLGFSTGGKGTYNLQGGMLGAGTIQLNAGTFNQTGGTLAFATFNQTGGTSTFAALNVDGAAATYNLSGAGKLTVTGNESIGSAANGNFNQTGGTNIAATFLVGNTNGATGAYTLAATSGTGSLSVSGSAYVGYSGTGTFTQNGGSISTGSLLYLGLNSTATGTYTLNSGTATIGTVLRVGQSGTGYLNLNGGTLNIGTNLNLGEDGGHGTVNMISPASITIAGDEYIGGGGTGATGVFTQTGGTNSAPDFYVGHDTLATGTFNLSGTGQLNVNGIEEVGQMGTGNFVQTGGTNAFSGGATGFFSIGQAVGSSGAYSLSGNGLLSVNGAGAVEIIGNNGPGAFTQSGGTHEVNGADFVFGDAAGVTGSYALSGATSQLMVVGQEEIGFLGNGTFTQTAGLHHIQGSLFLGYNGDSTGTYTLSSTGTLFVTGNETIGAGGTGTFTQTGGSNTTDIFMDVGSSGSTVGTYNLQGGTLSAPSITVPAGGTFLMTGGLLDCNAFNLNGGSATFPAEILDSGTAVITVPTPMGDSQPTFNITSGQLTIINAYLGYAAGTNTYTQTAATAPLNAGSLVIAYDPAASATYNLNGGTLPIATEFVAYDGNGILNQNGGANLPGTLYVGYGTGSTGNYTLAAGTLTDGNGEYVGYAGTGQFNQSAGVNTISGANNLLIGNIGGGVGTYSLSGTGSLNVGGIEYIGAASRTSGTFNQTGGTNTASGIVELAGVYNLSGGVLASPTFEIGLNATSLASLLLSSTGATSISGIEYVGFTGQGEISQTGGVNNCGTLILANSPASSGVYNLSGGNATVAGDAFIGGGVTGSSGASALRVSGGNLTIDGELNIWPVTGKVSLTGGTISAGGLNTNSVPANFLGDGVTTGWTAGTLDITGSGGLALSASGPLGANLSLHSGQNLIVKNTLANSGALTLGVATATVGGITGAGSLTINNGGAMQITPHGPVNSVNSLTINGGSLDITDNSLVINYGTNNPSPVGTIGAYIQSGYAGATFTGPGIISSQVAAVNASLSNSHAYAIGYADASDPAVAADHFTPGTVVIEPALVGDANLDGKVNFADFLLLASSFNDPGASWDQGNFDYGPKTDFGDFLLLAANFGQSTSLDNAQHTAMNQLASTGGYTLTANPDGTGFSVSMIPEPAAISILVAAGAGFLSRRRRRLA